MTILRGILAATFQSQGTTHSCSWLIWPAWRPQWLRAHGRQEGPRASQVNLATLEYTGQWYWLLAIIPWTVAGTTARQVVRLPGENYMQQLFLVVVIIFHEIIMYDGAIVTHPNFRFLNHLCSEISHVLCIFPLKKSLLGIVDHLFHFKFKNIFSRIFPC